VAIGIGIVRRRGTPGAPEAPATRRGPSDRGFSPSDRGYSPSDRGYSPSDPDYPPPADRSARPRRPEGTRPPSAQRRADRNLDHPAPPASRGARDADPWERERWYRTDSHLTAS
jgi:hypothetical protein